MSVHKIGICAGIGARYKEDRYKKLRQFGFTHVDFGLADTETEFYKGTPEERDAAILNEKAKANEAGIVINQVHGPFRWPICDITVEERAERMEKMKHSIRATALLECKYWVIHPMMPFGWEERKMYPDHEKETRNINLAFFKELLVTAKEYDVVICLENMPMVNFSIGSVQEVYRFVKEMDDDHFKICLDTGHASVYPNQSVGDAVRLMGDEIRCLHVHDNNGRNDNHWLPYHGVIDWEDFANALKEIGYQGVFSYETNPPGKMPEKFFEATCRMMVDVAKDLLN
jgi:sugar phosphate isomerase/epimerase